MRVRIVTSLDSVSAEAWRPLEAPGFPFADHEFLAALEASGSIGDGTGWQPLYLLAEEDDGTLAGALCAYGKGHSYGEYIFDWEWARFYRRNGVDYYPKLLAAAPFTPATGPKLLVRPGADAPAIRSALVQASVALAERAAMTSVHALFITPEEQSAFTEHGFAIRHSCQYHWRNRGYRDFQDFLDALIGKRRRDVTRERRRANDHGLAIEVVTGAALTAKHAAAMEQLYLTTAEKKDAIPYLRPGFFTSVFDSMRDRIVLVTASSGDGIVAAALNFVKDTTLFGRYWGTLGEYQDLHFELCYYRTIEYAIEKGLTLFEAGAQGEHKIQRGFLPSVTLSAHRIFAPEFRAPIESYIAEERAEVDRAVEQLDGQSPFKDQPGPVA